MAAWLSWIQSITNTSWGFARALTMLGQWHGSQSPISSRSNRKRCQEERCVCWTALHHHGGDGVNRSRSRGEFLGGRWCTVGTSRTMLFLCINFSVVLSKCDTQGQNFATRCYLKSHEIFCNYFHSNACCNRWAAFWTSVAIVEATDTSRWRGKGKFYPRHLSF